MSIAECSCRDVYKRQLSISLCVITRQSPDWFYAFFLSTANEQSLQHVTSPTICLKYPIPLHFLAVSAFCIASVVNVGSHDHRQHLFRFLVAALHKLPLSPELVHLSAHLSLTFTSNSTYRIAFIARTPYQISILVRFPIQTARGSKHRASGFFLIISNSIFDSNKFCHEKRFLGLRCLALEFFFLLCPPCIRSAICEFILHSLRYPPKFLNI